MNRYIKKTVYALFFVVFSCTFTTCHFRPPAGSYVEVKTVGININDNNLYILIDFGSVKFPGQYFSGMCRGISIYRYTQEVHQFMMTPRRRRTPEMHRNLNEFLVFGMPLEDYRAHRWEKINDDYYIRGESMFSSATRTLFLSEEFKYKGRQYYLIKIELERNDKRYHIRKIGDIYWDCNPIRSMNANSARSRGVNKGSGYFEEGVEYLIDFIPFFNHHHGSPAIPPVRFIVIKGIPMIRLADY
jgi:hypothetical protein